MIKRYVKLTFKPENVSDFLAIFEGGKSKIRSFEGCHSLALLQDKSRDNVFFTASTWENEAALEQYRQSDFFKQTWSKTKVLFEDKPMAWTLNTLDSL